MRLGVGDYRVVCVVQDDLIIVLSSGSPIAGTCTGACD